MQAKERDQFGWTQFIHGCLKQADQELRFNPILDAYKLQMMSLLSTSWVMQNDL